VRSLGQSATVENLPGREDPGLAPPETIRRAHHQFNGGFVLGDAKGQREASAPRRCLVSNRKTQSFISNVA